MYNLLQKDSTGNFLLCAQPALVVFSVAVAYLTGRADLIIGILFLNFMVFVAQFELVKYFRRRRHDKDFSEVPEYYKKLYKYDIFNNFSSEYDYYIYLDKYQAFSSAILVVMGILFNLIPVIEMNG